MNVLTSQEMWVLGGLFSVVLLLIGVVWNQLYNRMDKHEKSVNEKFADHDEHIGQHYSYINDLKVDLSSLKTNVLNHSSKFDDINLSISNLRDMVDKGLNRINDKLDNWRERRE